MRRLPIMKKFLMLLLVVGIVAVVVKLMLDNA